MNTKTKRLPAKLSDLIGVAVKDLSAVERSRKYKVDMNVWHNKPNRACHVCLGGAVIAKTLDSNSEETIWPGRFSESVRNRLFALNSVRVNALGNALVEVRAPKRRTSATLARKDIPTIPRYSKAKSPLFKRALRRLAKILREEGL